MIKPVEKDFGKMMDAVRNAGGLFYQYRACRRDTATIYDIENIRHGVAYAQTPLNMNDPFDSMIGYSKEKFYFESIDMILQSINADERLKTFLAFMIKHEIVGKSAEFLSLLQRIKAFFKHRQASQHVRNIPFGAFVTQNAAALYSKAPKDIRNKCDKSVFLVLAFIVGKSGDIAISMDFIKKLFELDNILTEIRQKIDYTEKTYVKLLRDFLAKLTVSCFSSSGWDNQLMWSHYANAYKGICIEYDFSNFNEVIGFIYPIHYSSERPTLSLKDVGILGVAQTKPANILQGDIDPASILAYLLAKNDCWHYEKEWRIINIEAEPNTPRFIKMPKIKSVTLGINVDRLCRQLLIDVCSENDIECYELQLSNEEYLLERVPCVQDEFDIEKEGEYINLLATQFINTFTKFNSANEFVWEEIKKNKDLTALVDTFALMIDMLTDVYFMNKVLHRFYKNANADEVSSMLTEKFKQSISQLQAFISACRSNADNVNLAKPAILALYGGRKESARRFENQVNTWNELVKKAEAMTWYPEATQE